MPRPYGQPVQASVGYQAQVSLIRKALPPQTIHGRWKLGRLIDKACEHSGGASTNRVLQDVSARLACVSSPPAGCERSYLAKAHQFYREWQAREAKLLDRAGISWRLVIELMKHRRVAGQNGPLNTLLGKLGAGEPPDKAQARMRKWLSGHRGKLATREHAKLRADHVGRALANLEQIESTLWVAAEARVSGFGEAGQARARQAAKELRRRLAALQGKV